MTYLGNETYEFRNGMKLNFNELKWILEELQEEYENNMDIRNLLDIIFKDIKEYASYEGFRNGYDEGIEHCQNIKEMIEKIADEIKE